MKRYLLILLLFAHPVFSAEEALIECRQIEMIMERVACYDKFVDSHYEATSKDDETPNVVPVAAESAELPDAQSLFGTSDAEAKRIVETTMSIEQIDHIEARITDVRESATRKLTVALDNGQIWRQLDSKSLRLKSGEVVIVRKASLGSYLLEKKSGSRSIRVKRAN